MLQSVLCERTHKIVLCQSLQRLINCHVLFQVIVFADSLIPTVRRALCDPLPEVREAAAKTFDNLHANIGPRALDDILPDLLEKLVSTMYLVCEFLFK